MESFEERTAYMEIPPKSGWKDTPPSQAEARHMALRTWGTAKGGMMEWSPVVFHRPNADYEFWCKLWWCMAWKLHPLEKGKSYKKAVMELCGVHELEV